MNKKQRKALADYTASVAAAFELCEWRIIFVDEPPKTTVCAIAEIRPIPGRRVAHLRVRDDFLDNSRASIRRIITHEVLHLACHDLADVIRAFCDLELISGPVAAVLQDRANMAEEVMVDRLSYVLAEMLDDDDENLLILRPDPGGFVT